MAKIVENEHTIDEGISTVLAPDIEFEGTLKFKTSLMVKGKVNGKIKADGLLVVGPRASVKAQVKAGEVTNYGSIEGDVKVGKRLEMKQGATQLGDVSTPDLIIESGCVVNGAVEMTNKKGSSG